MKEKLSNVRIQKWHAEYSVRQNKIASSFNLCKHASLILESSTADVVAHPAIYHGVVLQGSKMYKISGTVDMNCLLPTIR